MKRNQDEGEERVEGSDRWLLTYSDMITLLLVLFIMMYTISTVDTVKFEALAEQLGIVLGPGTGGLKDRGGNSNINNNDSQGIPLAASTAEAATSTTPSPMETTGSEQSIEDKLKSLIHTSGLSATVSVQVERRGVVVSFQEVLFPSGSAAIKVDAMDTIKKLAEIANSVGNYISIEGSTDNVPIKTNQFPSNWELASQRAINMVKLLVEDGLDPARISAISYGEYRPVAANDTKNNKAVNRRVDIVFIDEKLNVYQADYNK